MNFILNQTYSDGNTPIRTDEAEQLIPRISTLAELNEYEAVNILRAREWAFDSRIFDNVWKWAGTYRKTQLNIGCDPEEILQRIPQVLANTRLWLNNKIFSMDEALLRFHHQLTKIHPFANGNGRHARLMADILAVKHGQSEFTWGAGKDLVTVGDARTRYLAALRALDANENDVKLLLDFARS
jgi:Fic-DOC domain mobile mystery protein B